jgi:DNA (cytosine-5)-methyltransferase 1
VAAFPKAVPQRRRRLFVIGYLGDWLYPAEVLFDGEMRVGDTPPRRDKSKELPVILKAALIRQCRELTA